MDPTPASAHLTDTAIDIAALLAETAAPGCGAVVLFLGTVRDRQADRAVTAITYSAFRPLAERVLATIEAELDAEHPGLRVRIVHRLGTLEVGEASVAIASASPHRAAAYTANRRALERLKSEAPIWKLERYRDGERRWREEEPLNA